MKLISLICGVHNINLDITDTNGCFDNTSVTFDINGQPQFSFTVSPGPHVCPKEELTFINTSQPSLQNNTIDNFLWTFTSIDNTTNYGFEGPVPHTYNIDNHLENLYSPTNCYRQYVL